MTETVARPTYTAQALTLGPSLVVSLFIAETFFKFGSFSLEFLAWAATFGALFAAQRAVTRLFGGR